LPAHRPRCCVTPTPGSLWRQENRVDAHRSKQRGADRRGQREMGRSGRGQAHCRNAGPHADANVCNGGQTVPAPARAPAERLSDAAGQFQRSAARSQAHRARRSSSAERDRRVDKMRLHDHAQRPNDSGNGQGDSKSIRAGGRGTSGSKRRPTDLSVVEVSSSHRLIARRADGRGTRWS